MSHFLAFASLPMVALILEIPSCFVYPVAFFQGASASLRRSEGGPRPNRLWTLSAPGAGKDYLDHACIQPPYPAAYQLGNTSPCIITEDKQH